MKMKRLLAWVALLALIVCQLPAPHAHAHTHEETGTDDSIVLPEDSFGSITAGSGTCGDNLTWTLDTKGLLIISGTGDMYDYLPNDVPWGSYKDIVREIVIKDGVTGIGEFAFYGCADLTEIALPSSATSIGDHAFYDTSLETVIYCGTEELWDIISIADGNEVFTGAAVAYHDFQGGDCETPAECVLCGETKGEIIGHSWVDATCTTPKTCSVCGVTEGGVVHSWVDATCTAPKTCSLCGETEGAALGHSWKAATCTEPKTCSACGETEGEALGHSWVDASCTAPKTCSACGETEGDVVHSWKDATCTAPETCALCGETRGEPLGHSWDAATCTDPRTCSVCGATDGAALGHSWIAANCTTPKTCSVCGVTEGGVVHSWVDATCTAPKTCSLCGETEGEALGHTCEVGICDRCGNPVSTNGTIGANLTWKLDGDGLLTISGNGEMIFDDGVAPWDAYKASVSKIVIEDGVTGICEFAFYDCENLSEITIGDDVAYIGDYAFYNCTSLTGIALPDSVTAVGNQAFRYCFVLTDVSLGNVASIGEYAFSNTAVTEIVIPGSVNSIGYGAFYSCSLKAVTYCGTEEQWAQINIGASNKALTDAERAYHTFSGGCMEPETCSICGAEKILKAHAWIDATCTAPKTCSVCGETEGEALGHTTEKGVCERCNKLILDDDAFELPEDPCEPHKWVDATCTAPKTCSVCGTTVGEPLGHEWTAGSCTGAGSCTRCGLVAGEPLGHTWIDATCTTPKTCSVCGETEGEALGHTWVEPTCTTPWTCAVCGTTFGDVVHSWVDATCTTRKTCALCGATTGTALGHTCKNGTCERCGEYIVTLIASGTCGNNLTWTLNTDGLLTISGTGSMGDYEYEGDLPWFDYRSSVKTVVIEDGVTSIGNHAFRLGYNSLTSVTIPDSVTIIGEYAFESCIGLTEILIPNSVTVIGDGAFSCCDNLISINIPDSVTSMGNYVFYYCDSLTSVTIGNGVTSIGDYAFHCCNDLTSVTISDSVTSIGNNAFSFCTALTSVTIPDSVTSIGEAAFWSCDNLTSVTIPDSVTSIGNSAFVWCCRLASVTIGNGVTSIGELAFHYCTALTSINIPNSVTSIGNSAFDGCSGLNKVTYCGTSEQWKQVSIGSENEVLSTAARYYHDYVDGTCQYCGEELGGQDFVANGICGTEVYWQLDGDGVLTIYGKGAMKNLSTTNMPWYDYRDSIKHVIVESGVTTIGNCAFYGFTALTKVTVQESVTTIGSYAFCACKNLVEVNLPTSLSSVGERAFHNCSGITKVTYCGTSTQWGQISFAANNTYLTNVTRTSHSYIGLCVDPAACAVCGNVRAPMSHTWADGTCTEPKTCTSCGATDGTAPGHTWIDATCTDPKTCSVCSETEGEALGHTSETGICERCGETPVELIASGNCGDNLKWKLDVNGLLTITGKGAMKNFSATNMPWYAYRDSIKEVMVKNGVTSIGNCAFYGFTALTKVTMQNGATTIGGFAFCGCSNLAEVNLPGTMTSIGERTFHNCTSLTKVTYCGTDTQWGQISIHTSNTVLTKAKRSSHSFTGNCAEYAYCVVCSAEREPGEHVWLEATCTDPVTCSICGDTEGEALGHTCETGDCDRCGEHLVKVIGSGSCGYKATWTLDSDGLLTISGTGAMQNFSTSSMPWYAHKDIVRFVIVESGVTTVGNCSFYGFTALTKVTIMDGATAIGSYAFCGCTSLAEVNIPDDVTTIGERAFHNCSKLAKVTYCGTEEQWSQISIDASNPYLTAAARVEHAYVGSCTESTACVVCGNVRAPLAHTCETGICDRCGLRVVKIIASGDCGNGVSWKLDSDDVLTIYGKGVMKNYSTTNMPWYAYKDVIKTVVVEKGVTNVGNCAFYGFTALTKVVINDGPTAIGSYVFCGCTSLTEVAIPDSVATIGERAFHNCSKLSKVTFCGSATQWSQIEIHTSNTLLIEAERSYHAYSGGCTEASTCAVCGTWRAAQGHTWTEPTCTAPKMCVNCSAAEGQALGHTCEKGTCDRCGERVVEVIASGTCGLKTIWKLDVEGRLTISGIGAMQNFKTDNMPWYAYKNAITEVVIESGVTNVGNCAFYGFTALTKVTIMDGVTTIGSYAFCGCTGLTEVTIAKTVTSIQDRAFHNCNSLSKVIYGGTEEQWGKISIVASNTKLTAAERVYA